MCIKFPTVNLKEINVIGNYIKVTIDILDRLKEMEKNTKAETVE
jgi:hypothetical protein